MGNILEEFVYKRHIGLRAGKIMGIGGGISFQKLEHIFGRRWGSIRLEGTSVIYFLMFPARERTNSN